MFCSSVLGLIAAPYRGAYCAAKFAVEALADTLRMELAGTGIHVVLIEPGPIASRFVEHALEAYRRNIDLERSAHRDIYRARIARMEEGGSKPSSSGRRPWWPSSSMRWKAPRLGRAITSPGPLTRWGSCGASCRRASST